MKGKIFTPDELNRMMPLLRPIVRDIVAEYHMVSGELGKNSDLRTKKRNSAEAEASDRKVGEVIERFQALIKEVEDLGGVVKDYEEGCCDFYAEIDGEIVYLCWRLDEETCTHYHGVEDGSAKRKKLRSMSRK